MSDEPRVVTIAPGTKNHSETYTVDANGLTIALPRGTWDVLVNGEPVEKAPGPNSGDSL